MKLLLVAACLVAVNAVPLKKSSSDYDYVMSQVEHAYQASQGGSHYDSGFGHYYQFGKREEENQHLLGSLQHLLDSLNHHQHQELLVSKRLSERELGDILTALGNSLNHVQEALTGVFAPSAQHTSESLSHLIQTGLQPAAEAINGILGHLQHSNMVDVQKRDLFNLIGSQLQQTMEGIGHLLQGTFQGLSEGGQTLTNLLGEQPLVGSKRAERDLFSLIGSQLQQTMEGIGHLLQGTFQGLSQGGKTLTNSLQGEQPLVGSKRAERNLFGVLGNQLQHTFESIGSLLQGTFEELSAGGDLLHSTLQQGAQTALNGANTLAQNSETP